MTCRRRRAEEPDDERQTGVDRRTETSGIVDARNEENDADRNHGHPLQRTQRAGIEPESVLEP